MFIACEELRNMAKSCRCRLHESDDFDSIIEEYSRLYYPHTGTPTDKVHFEFKLKEAKAIYDALSGEVTATISRCLKDIRDVLTDKRSETKIIYPLDVMVTVILLARLCGNITAVEVVNFYRARNLELQYLIPGMPRPRYRLSESTVNCVMRMFSPEEINKLLESYFSAVKTALCEMIKAGELRERPKLADKETVSFDGQEIVSSYRKGESSRRKKGAVGVSVYNSTHKIALAVKSVLEKNHEVPAFLSLLPNLDIRGTIVMSDALNSLSEVSTAILRHGADYLLCLKDNGGNKELRGHLEAIFNREYAKQEKSAAISRYLCEKGHGRIDETLLETLPANLIDERIENPHQGINTIVKYTKTRTYLINGKTDKTTASSRYYVCSLVFSGQNTDRILYSLLDYWAIEQHHSRLDDPHVFNQDATRSCSDNYLGNTLGINKIALNILTWIRHQKAVESGKKVPPSYKSIQHMLNTSSLTSVFEYLAAYYFEANTQKSTTAD